MTEQEKDAVRARVKADDERFSVGLAPYYLGKFCPLTKEECRGPACMVFMPYNNPETGKLVAACAIPLAASQIGPVADALMQFAARVTPLQRGVIPESGGVVR